MRKPQETVETYKHLFMKAYLHYDWLMLRNEKSTNAIRAMAELVQQKLIVVDLEDRYRISTLGMLQLEQDYPEAVHEKRRLHLLVMMELEGSVTLRSEHESRTIRLLSELTSEKLCSFDESDGKFRLTSAGVTYIEEGRRVIQNTKVP